MRRRLVLAVIAIAGCNSHPSAKARTSTPGTTSGTLGVVEYTIELPGDYTLTHDDKMSQTWRPPGDGLTLELALSPGPHTLDSEGRPITAPCPSSPEGAGSSKTIDGVERQIDISTHQCMGPDLMVHCSVSHTRGYIEPAEKPAAIALCKSLAATRQSVGP